MNPVLIIATRYDKATNCTYEWAGALRSRLLSSGKCDVCMLLDGESLCRAGSTLVDAISRVDYVVFFGHGETDRWIALPSGNNANSAALVGGANVSVLDGRNVFSACCYALSGLGADFAQTSSNFAPVPDFVGYKNAFNVHLPNENYFRDVVVDSIHDFIVNHTSASTTVTNQKGEWGVLDKKFSSGGTLSSNPEAWTAASNARSNAVSIGHT